MVDYWFLFIFMQEFIIGFLEALDFYRNKKKNK